jgi:hypothetical protein
MNGDEGTGSGFIIRGDYIVTNDHGVTLDGAVTLAALQVVFNVTVTFIRDGGAHTVTLVLGSAESFPTYAM